MAKVAGAHYSVYPQEKVNPLWAYAFRPFFLLIPIYMGLSLCLWLGVFLGGISLPFVSNVLHLHIYELLFGIGSAGVVAFLLTAVPEMFPGSVPIIGKQLKTIVVLWIGGRIGFWGMELWGVYTTAILNITLLLVVLFYVYKPILGDKNRRHISLLVALLGLCLLQIGYFSTLAGIWKVDTTAVLYLTIGLYMVLILLVLRRVTIEVVNAFLSDDDFDEVYFSRPPRYNLTIFIILLFSFVEWFFPHNSVLGWLGLAAGAATLGILNDFILDDKRFWKQPLIQLIVAIYLFIASAYLLMGWDYLNDNIYAINHFRHLLTTGAFSLSFYLIMIIVSTVHTGREFQSDFWLNLGGGILILSALIRASIAFFPENAMVLYVLSGLLACLPFAIFLWRYGRRLITVRADGLPG